MSAKRQQRIQTSTINYGMFKLLTSNRQISEAKIKTLDASVKAIGWRGTACPILVNEKYEVLDGQHRLEYAKRNRLPISYTIQPGLDEHAMIVLNSIDPQWRLQDYIHHYAALDYPAYVTLQGLLDRWSDFFDCMSVVYALTGEQTNTRTIKAGTLPYIEGREADADRALEWLYQLQPILRKAGSQGKYNHAPLFCLGLPGFDPKRMAKAIMKQPTEVVPVARTRQAIDQLEHIYNRGRQTRMFLAEEYKKSRTRNHHKKEA